MLAAIAALAAPALSRSGAGPTWQKVRSAPLARTEVGAARANNFIYVIGGFVPGRDGATNTAAVERYDLARDRWHRVRSAPVALNHAAVASYRGRVYVVGGYRSRHGLAHASRAFLRYDPQRDRWETLPPAPSARAALGAAVIGDRLYAVGGARDGRALRTLDIYDFARRRWSRGGAMPTAREHLAVASTGGRLYALGGRARGRGNMKTVERYDPRRREWTRVEPLLHARGGCAAAALGHLIVVFGGEEAGGTIGGVERLDTRGGGWQRLARMRTPRHGLGGAAYAGRIYALEGGPRPGFSYSRAAESLVAGS